MVIRTGGEDAFQEVLERFTPPPPLEDTPSRTFLPTPRSMPAFRPC